MPPKPDIIRRRFESANKNRAVTLVYNGVTASGLRGGISEQAEWQVNTYRSRYMFSVWVDAEAYAPTPITSKTVDVDGTTRRILGVWPDSIGALIRLDLGDQYART
jgi:hypothetical protein